MVEGAIQGESLGDPTRPREQFWPLLDAAACLDLSEPHHGFAGADEYGGSFTSGARYEVEHVVHAIAEVDVGSASFLPHGRVARGSAVPGMARRILGAPIGLDFRNAHQDFPMVEVLTQQLPRHDLDWPQEKRLGYQPCAAKHCRPRI